MRNHKYIAKVNTPSGIRYFYDQAEYAAYQNSKSGFNRPHSRTPKVAKTWYGATEQAKVFKGNRVHYDKNGKVRKSAFFGKKVGTPVSGSTPGFITNSLAADSKKMEKARKARKEKQYESLNSVFEYQERMEKEAAAAAKKRVARKKRRAANLVKIVNGVMRRN